MQNKMVFNIIMYVLMGISVLLTILYFVGSVKENLFLNWAYILIGLATASAIIFPIVNIIQNPKKAKIVIAGVVGLLVIFGVAYAMASGHEVKLGEDTVIPADTVKMVDAGLKMTYLLGALSILSVIYVEVSKMFK